MRYSSYKYFLLMLFVINIPMRVALAESLKSAEQYWSGTGLTLYELRAVVRPELCNRSAETFASCAISLDQALTMIDSTASIVPEPTDSKSTVLKSFGRLAVVKKSEVGIQEQGQDKQLSQRQLWQQIKAEREKIKAKFAAVYDVDFDFGAVVDYLGGLMAFRKDKAYIIAFAINKVMQDVVDPHSYIMPTEMLNEEMSSNGDDYSGVGIMVQPLGQFILIQNLIEGGPAHKAGLRAQDIIERIDGHSVKGMEEAEVTRRLRGRAKTSVELTIKRRGQNLVIKVLRGKVQQDNVTAKLLSGEKGPIGYLRLRSFTSQLSCKDIENALVRLEKQGAKSLIFDLRSNGGGLVDQAVCIGGLFVGKQVIVQVLDLASGQFTAFQAEREAITRLPMLTLINAGSASASEIIAGALQDYQRSWVAGQRSFGKGSVQAGMEFGPHRGQLVTGVTFFLTIRRFYQPSGRTNQVVGIDPEFNLEPKPQATEDDRFALREAELYPNALPPEGPKWKTPRPEKVAQLQKCARTGNKIARMYSLSLQGPLAPDYELIQAQVLSDCQLQLGL